MIVEGAIRRKSPGDALVHLAGHVDGQVPGTATDRTRSALPIISPQKHGPSAGAPPRLGWDWCVA